MARHAFEPHTGEVQLRVEASSRAELYAEAGRALAALVTERVAGPPSEAEEVEVTGRDPEALLVAWIDELVFRTDTTGFAYADIDVVEIDEGRLRATIRGRRLEAVRTAVKAATFHQVQVTSADGAWSARLVLDV